MAEKPTAAFILSLIGAVLILIQGLIIAVFASIIGAAIGIFHPMFGGLVIIIGVAALSIGIIMLVGAFMINSEDKSRVMTGSILVLVLAIIGFFVGGGFFIGSILCIVGSILGLTWKPSEPAYPPPPVASY